MEIISKLMALIIAILRYLSIYNNFANVISILLIKMESKLSMIAHVQLKENDRSKNGVK